MNNQFSSFDLKKWKVEDKILTKVAKTLTLETSWKELLDLEELYDGITIKYWRMHFPKMASWIEFLRTMQVRFPEQYWPDENESEAVSEDKFTLENAIEIADRLNKEPFKLDVDAMIAEIIKDNP